MLRCSGAVFSGLLAVAVITMGLMIISDADEPPAETAAYTISFPEDEQMLKDLSLQLMRESETGDLTAIEPAAGTVTPSSPAPANALAAPEQK